MREIRCVKCAQDSELRAYPSETVRTVAGVLILHCRCDLCNVPLGIGEQAVAVTVFNSKKLVIPRGWEDEYLTVKKENQ